MAEYKSPPNPPFFKVGCGTAHGLQFEKLSALAP